MTTNHKFISEADGFAKHPFVLQTLFLALALVISGNSNAVAENDLPVTEVTIFKDGHSILHRTGEAKVDVNGTIQINDLPRPVMGTFWSYCVDPKASLSSVSVGNRKIESSRTIRSHLDFVKANIGKKVSIVIDKKTIEGKIADVYEGQMALIQMQGNSYRLLSIQNIQDITILEKPVLEVTDTKNELSLEMKLKWDGKPKDTAEVGMVYLQKGIRWIPSYKIELGDGSMATVKLQATLLNEMIDLEHAKVRMVVGVPSFKFKDTLDPISGATAQQLSNYFQSGSQAAYAMSNAMVTQVARMGDHRGRNPGNDPGNIPGADKLNEKNPGELFLFEVDDVTLKKGDRQVRTLAEWKLPYEEIYKLELDAFPPTEFHQYRNSRANELQKLMSAPKVKRYIRLLNKSDAPLTTAPALIVDGERKMVLAQSMMTYAAIGSRVDLEVTAAVDIQVAREDRETGRKSNALKHDGHQFQRVDLVSTVSLTNYRDEPLQVEVVRRLIGKVDSASDDGKVVTPLYNEQERYRPYWWYGYSWPYWWSYLNTVQVTRWNVELAPGKTKSMSVNWHYFWR